MKAVRHFLKVIIFVLCTALVVLSHATVYADDKLNPGETLKRGDNLTSANGQYKLLMQKDGNLVLYGPRNQPLWSSNTGGRPVEKCMMQRDGNLVLYLRDGQPVWASNTDRIPGSFLLLQNDGNLVIYQPVWSSSTERSRRDDRDDRREHDKGGDKGRR
jgi:hypothetical protein